MSSRLRPRLNLFLWVLLLAFGADGTVALAQEIHPGGEDGQAWVRHSGARASCPRLLPDLPGAPTALPACSVELAPLGAWTRVPPTAWRRRPAPRAAALPSAYPRGPPA